MKLKPLSAIAAAALVIACASACAQNPCAPADANRAATLALGLQYKLLSHKAVDKFEIDAPSDVSSNIVMFRKSLDVATQAFFHCEAAGNSDAQALQTALGKFLHVDQSKQPRDPDARTGVYAANLRVKVTNAPGLPDSVFVLLTFEIKCGDDNVLLVFQRRSDAWRERLHWYSDKYSVPSDAFGDIFSYAIVPGLKSDTPLIAVAHGHPWCTSRFSSFDVDLLQPTKDLTPQKQLAHMSNGYDRTGDNAVMMKPTATGFTLNVSITSDDPLAPPLTRRTEPGPLTLPVVFRYNTVDATLRRISVTAH